MSQCPCGSAKEVKTCCAPLHAGERKAQTAEELMRSRYSAFVLSEIDYIIETNHADTRHEINRAEVEEWSKSSSWNGLEVVSTENGGANDDSGIVEFKANYTLDGKPVVHHERGEFSKVAGQWYFVDGQIIRDSIRRDGPKIGRNDPCFCGSGKKYKKCCYQ